MFSSLIAPSLMPRAQFEQTAGAAFNDPLSNVVFLGQTLSRAQVLRSFREGTYPAECLGPFLHEGTHHRCFDTRAGYALLGIESFSRMSWMNTLKCRAPRSSSIACSTNPTCFNRAFIRALYHLLTPLAEGLALFGELDATPGTSSAASALLLNTLSVFFYSKQRALLTEPNANLQILIGQYQSWLSAERAREDGTFVQTRALLAQEPPSPAVQPYKAGYAWITKLVETLHRYSPEARNDFDVTLAFLCSYFFDDSKLAAMIAASSWNMVSGEPEQTLKDVGQYLRERAEKLRHRRIARFFDEYSSALTAGNIRTCPFLNFTNKRAQFLESFNAQAAANELNWQAPKTTKFRHILRVATMTADSLTLDIRKGTFECRIEDTKLEGPALRGGFPASPKQNKVEAHDLETAFELVLLKFELLACIFYKGNLVAVTDRQFRSTTDQTIENILGGLSPFANAEHWRQRYWGLLDPDPDTTCGAYLEDRLSEAKSLVDSLYS